MNTDKLKFQLLKSFLNWCYENDLRPFIIVEQFKDFPLDESYFVNDVLPSLNGHAFISFISPYNEDLPKEATYLSSIVIFK